MPRPDNAVTWAITSGNEPISDAVADEAGPLQLYTYAGYTVPYVVWGDGIAGATTRSMSTSPGWTCRGTSSGSLSPTGARSPCSTTSATRCCCCSCRSCRGSGSAPRLRRKDLQVELKALQAELGITFVFVTHDQEEALTTSDRLAVMSGARGEVKAMIRPERVGLEPQGTTGDNRLPGLVERAVYVGSAHELHVRLVGGGLLKATVMNDGSVFAYEEGSPVTLHLPPEELRVLAGS